MTPFTLLLTANQKHTTQLTPVPPPPTLSKEIPDGL